MSMDWDDIRFFLAVARNGSLTAAAAQLKNSPATVSRHLKQLEKAVGFTFFVNTRAGYKLTAEGSTLFEHATSVEEAINGLTRQAADTTETAAGHVTLTTNESVGHEIVIPALPKFRSRHPQITLEVHATSETLDISKGKADIAIRLFRPKDGNVTVRKLGDLNYAAYGTRGYIAKLPSDKSDWIKEADRIGWPDDFQMANSPNTHPFQEKGLEPTIMFNSLSAQVAAVKAGLGVGCIPCIIGDKDDSLQRIDNPSLEASFELWLVTHRDLRTSPRIRAVSQFLVDLFNPNSAASQKQALHATSK